MSKTSHIVNPATRTAPWEDELEDALCYATPAEVLIILRKIKGWTLGYCETCGEYNATDGGKRGCKCSYKGWWDENP